MIDYHVHFWPHAKRADEGEAALERVAAYVEEAARHGVGELALTEHYFRFRQARAVVDRWWGGVPEGAERELGAAVEAYFDWHATADLDLYVEGVLAAKRAGLPVLLGLEVDYYPGRMDEVSRFLAGYPFDVLLGSVHWLGNWMFDDLHSATQQREWDHRSVETAWREYATALEELAATGACDVLAHPDLVKLARHYPDPGVVAECEERIAEGAAVSGMAAEISSAGANKPCAEDYPSPSLLSRFASHGVPVTLASDSHGTGRVAERSGELLSAARAAGYRSLRRFRRRVGEDLQVADVEGP